MKILGVGLSKTGTTSLYKALQILGFNCIHFDSVRLNDILDGSNPNPDFRRYDDVDAVTDIPSAYFYRELLVAYPNSKAILTVRDVDSWWKSMAVHSNVRFPIGKPTLFSHLARILRLKRWPGRTRFAHDRFRIQLRNYIYGSTVAHEFLYKKKYLEHNEQVQADIPAQRLLVMNIIAGDGWEKLCTFLNKPIPSVPFPHAQKTNYKEFSANGAGLTSSSHTSTVSDKSPILESDR